MKGMKGAELKPHHEAEQGKLIKGAELKSHHEAEMGKLIKGAKLKAHHKAEMGKLMKGAELKAHTPMKSPISFTPGNSLEAMKLAVIMHLLEAAKTLEGKVEAEVEELQNNPEV